MRIVVVVSYYKPAYVYGGPVHSISAMCEALATLDTEMTVLTTNANGVQRLDVPLGEPVRVDGVKVVYYPLVPLPPQNFFYSPALARACAQKMSQFEVAVLDTFFTHAMGPAVAACQRARVPYLVPLRGQLLPWSMSYKRLKKQLYVSLFGRRYLNGAAGLHCTDPVEAEAAAKLGLRAPVFVVPNAIDVTRFGSLPLRGGLRSQLGIPDEAMVLLFLGRLHRKKRPDIAVHALAAVRTLPREVHLVLAGPDEEQLTPVLYRQAQHLGCVDHLHIIGLLEGDKVLQALADADLLLMPSEAKSENFGMSALEAMAAGLPVVVSEGVPVGHWAEEAGAGRMIPCTADAFSRTSRELLVSPEHLKTMGQRGQALARQQFDTSVVARKMLAQYQSIITDGHLLPDAEFMLKGSQEL